MYVSATHAVQPHVITSMSFSAYPLPAVVTVTADTAPDALTVTVTMPPTPLPPLLAAGVSGMPVKVPGVSPLLAPLRLFSRISAVVTKAPLSMSSAASAESALDAVVPVDAACP